MIEFERQGGPSGYKIQIYNNKMKHFSFLCLIVIILLDSDFAKYTYNQSNGI